MRLMHRIMQKPVRPRAKVQDRTKDQDHDDTVEEAGHSTGPERMDERCQAGTS